MKGLVHPLILLAALLALTACSGASGHAEPVDVPLNVVFSLRGGPDLHCARTTCMIPYRAVVTDGGSDPAYAMDCTIRALGRHGEVLATTPVGLGGPAGGYVGPEQPFHGLGNVQLTIPPESQTKVASLDGSCSAYMWHGTVPI